MDRFDYLVVGSGFAGATCAERLASAGKSVLLIDQRNHVAGNAFDHYNDEGILVQKYGPHIFHTNSQDVVTYLSKFTGWRPYEHLVLSLVNGQLVPMPINRTTLRAFGGDVEAAKDALIVPYTRKQWGLEPHELDPTVLARITPRDSYDDRYFTDAYQMMPVDGFTRLVQRMTTHRNITLLLNVPYREIASLRSWSRVVYTGPIDAFYGHCYGHLPYRSATFEFQTVPVAQYQPVAVVNYPSPDVAYTRITEFKHITGQQHPQTTIAKEYPQATGDPYWPIPQVANRALYARYKARATPDIAFTGRLGSYQYLNIDQVVAQSLKLSATILSKEQVCQG